ncbi:hypothetical protein [Paractinoplanes aksuensis]|nr:hypothetical protein [Actinoplanes aksuensis]
MNAPEARDAMREAAALWSVGYVEAAVLVDIWADCDPGSNRPP